MIKDGIPYTNENGWIDDELITDLPEEEQQKVFEWIREYIKPRRIVNRRHSSYGIKHALYHFTKVYVTNNQFKHAMLLCGYEPVDANELNWQYRISERSPAFSEIKVP